AARGSSCRRSQSPLRWPTPPRPARALGRGARVRPARPSRAARPSAARRRAARRRAVSRSRSRGHLLLFVYQFEVVLEVGADAEAARLLELAARGAYEVAHAYGLALVGGEEGRAEGYVLDVAARQLEPLGEEPPVYVAGERRVRREHLPPDEAAVARVRERELDDEAEPPDESLVDVLAEVAGEDDRALVLLDALEEEVDFDVGVAVVRVFDLRALAEDGVGLVEEEDGVALGRLVEDAAQIFLRLAVVLADDA